MVRLIKKEDRLNKNENYYYIKEGKQVGDLYHVCTLKALVEFIIPENKLVASGKYTNKLLRTKQAISFTRDPLFVVPTWTVSGSPILFQFVVDGDKLSDKYKITPYNGNGPDHKYFEKEEVVLPPLAPDGTRPIKNFKSYIKEVRFDVKSLFFKDTDNIIKYLKEVKDYLGSIPCKRKYLPFLQDDWTIDYKKTKNEFDLYKVKTLDELITLLERFKNIDIMDYIDSKELFGKYIENLSEDQLTTLLKNHPKWINVKDEDGNTPLYRAYVNNNIELVKILLELDADVNIKTKYGDSPLLRACRNDNTELVKLLIEHGADVNTKDKYGNTPLQWACKGNNIELVKLLLEHGADVNSENEDENTPLLLACFSYIPNIELIKLLLEHGADVNVRNKDGETPLGNACREDNKEIIKLLLEHGADVNVKDKYDDKPLEIACSKNDLEIVKLLLNYGASALINKYYNPLEIACDRRIPNLELIELLLEHGIGKNLDVNHLPDYITDKEEIEDLVLSYLNKSKNESIRVRRLYRRSL